VTALPDLPDPRLALAETAENVEALLETVRELLKAEESRDQSFNARGVGVAGFVGIIVSLSTTVGRDALQADLPGGWKALTVGLFGAALLLLLSTVIVVVRGVLAPQETPTLSYAAVVRYPEPRSIFQHRVMTQGKVMRGLVEALGIERARMGGKARALRASYRLLIAGLMCIAALGFIVGLADAGVIATRSSELQELTLCGQKESPVKLSIASSCP
jgi:hypothetical protein